MPLTVIKFVFFAFIPFLLKQGPIAAKAITNNRHPFYVSVAEVEHNLTAKSLEITVKFFADDFEHTLENNYKVPLDLSSANDKSLFDKDIPDYINRHFSIKANDKSVRLNYVGYEVQKESAYCYFEVLNIPSVKRIDITNTLLHDFSKQQMNIMHVSANGKRKSEKLDYPAANASFVF
jgi:hypothetical protein